MSENERGADTSAARAHIVYKIAPQQVWQAAERDGIYRGSPDDHRDGFIHLSSGAQVAGTLARHYTAQSNLALIAYDAAGLGGALKWEPSRGGEHFPHLYGPLDPAAALWVRPITLGADGRHIVPGDLA